MSGTPAVASVATYPYCGACGHDYVAYNIPPTLFCDSCGADLDAYGFAPYAPPTGISAVGGTNQVTVTFTANPSAATTILLYTVNGGATQTVDPVTSPRVIGSLTPGDIVVAVLASVDASDNPGPVSAEYTATATA